MPKISMRERVIKNHKKEFKVWIDCAVKTIRKHFDKNVQFLVLDRDARPIHNALKELGADSTLLPLSVALVPEKFGKEMYRLIPEHPDFLSESKGGSEYWLKMNKVWHDEAAQQVLKENNYFEGDPLVSALLEHVESIVDKNRRVVIIDTGYKGTIAVYLAHLLKRKGFNVDWDILLHNANPRNLRSAFFSLKMLELKTDAALEKVKSIKQSPDFKKPGSPAAEEYKRISEAISTEIVKRLRNPLLRIFSRFQNNKW